jgi:hypothetical protein
MCNKQGNIFFCDNVYAVYLMVIQIHHQGMKHIKLAIHFVCEEGCSRAVSCCACSYNFSACRHHNKEYPVS